MHYPTIQNVEAIIDELNLRYNVQIVIINRGQLEFALEKPMEKFGGIEMYPELYQKAAILMETMTKLHTLSDGNKRTAMLTAEFMIKANGGDMILPLKATRMSVDVAMDTDDIMKDEIQKWFKVHVAMNPYELSVMLKEHMEEEGIIKNLLKSGKIPQAKKLFGKWIAFDNYPEHKKEWDELEARWKQKDHFMSNSAENNKYDKWSEIWKSIINIAKYPHRETLQELIPQIDKIEDLLYNGHSMEDLDRINIELEKNIKILQSGKNHKDVYKAGHILQQFDKPKASIELFKKLCDTNDYKLDAMINIGKLLNFDCNDPQGSMEYWDKIKDLEPNNISMLIYRGSALTGLKKYDEAIACYNKILKEKPDHIDSLYGKGGVLTLMGKYEKALAVCDKGLKININSQHFHNLRGIVLADLGRKDSIDAHNKALELSPNNLRYMYNKASSLNELKIYDEAIKTYEKILKIDPNHLITIINLSGLFLKRGRQKESMEYLEKAIKINPNHPIALYKMGITLVISKQYEKAMPYFEKLIQNNLGVGDGHYGKAALYAKQGKITESLNSLENAIMINCAYKEIAKNNELFSNMKELELFKKLTDTK